MAEIIASTYEIIEKIGSGGGGDIYLANHLRLGKKVVLKADKREITTPPELLRREVDVLKELSHTYIPQVYDFFVQDGIVYTVIDYIEGESLDKPLKRGEVFSQRQVIMWAKQLLSALSYLHRPIHGDPPRGFVHSDIKPANLMRTRNGDICLIDFNITLALGETSTIGRSAGYASPEHYGLDFSTDGETQSTGGVTEELTEELTEAQAAPDDEETATVSLADPKGRNRELDPLTVSLPREEKGQKRIAKTTALPKGKKRVIVPDVRSDIYSVGATLYHLLSGVRPEKNAKEVVPLSADRDSLQLVKIITKAMNPNPDLRYQTADEMLYDLTHLHENDPRAIRLRKQQRWVCALLAVCTLTGLVFTFVGLKRMQTTEKWLKLAEYSQNALTAGDLEAAVDYAVQAVPMRSDLLTPAAVAQGQRALADALGVYDLADGYKATRTVELPSEVLYLQCSPNGNAAACVCSGEVIVFDTQTGEKMASLPAEKSALAEAHFLSDDVVLYSGVDGLRAYDIKAQKALWKGKPATAIRISGDGKSVAAVYKEESFATVYDAATGKAKETVSFQGKQQRVTVNDRFANPNDNLLAINQDGTKLSASFADGSLVLYDLSRPGEPATILDRSVPYVHFEGGFYENYLAFSASTDSKSVFAVVDADTKEQTGGFSEDGMFGVQTDENGIYVAYDNILVKMHLVTGEQTPLVSTKETIRHFAVDGDQAVIATEEGFAFYGKDAKLVSSYQNQNRSDLVPIANGTALVGSMDAPIVRVLRQEEHGSQNVFSYDPAYEHDEARVSTDRKTVMLFSCNGFAIYDKTGKVVKKATLPEPEQMYDQQFIRDQKGDRLEVTYYDGLVRTYDAATGERLAEERRDAPDLTLEEEFVTKNYRIVSPLHGAPEVHDLESDRLLYQLAEDAYLTYVTQVEDYLVTQYVTADGSCYGQLLNENCEVVADLPYLCDIADGTFFFDYPSGTIRQSRIYNLEQLIQIAKNQKGEQKK